MAESTAETHVQFFWDFLYFWV